MKQHASGSFEITMTPAGPPQHEGRTALGRMQLAKQYSGELAASGTGEMLTAVTDTPGSAAYVAIERITGTLQGRQGSFVIEHVGNMRGGEQQLSITVVADSGTEELAGIAGTLSLKVVDGKHVYEFDYLLP